MNERQALAFLAHCFVTGKASLSAEDLTRIQWIAGQHIAEGDHVKPRAGERFDEAVTGVVAELRADGKYSVTLDAPASMTIDGSPVTVSEVVVSYDQIEKVFATVPAEDPA